MAAIKAIQQKSVHQIQSGQVIVDLNSVVKELVENSVDAGSTSIEVRFRNHGLDAIEVVDNGSGISPDDYESVALKHHTSKLSTYDDLESLNTFGFRGEALASLCALSQLHVITARDVDAPKGRKLEFEMSGKLKSTTVVAAQRGTKVVVEKLFYNLPVRKKELEKNIKREYGKVLALLQAYACVSTGIRFVVSNQMPKANKNVAFATGINNTTKDNITNVFGAKTLHALVRLDLKLEVNSSRSGMSTQASSIATTQPDSASQNVRVEGHISRPVFGEGRQAPDRQFFFVNSRPCALPQVAKAFNEVYRSFNVSQSPFIFANLIMDTHAYDVNVSPDKRTILLHDQNELLEALKASLLDLFDAQEQSVPQSKLANVTQGKLPSYKPLTMTRHPDAIPNVHDNGNTRQSNTQASDDEEASLPSQRGPPDGLIHSWMGRSTVDREQMPTAKVKQAQQSSPVTVQNAFDRMRPPRTPAQVAQITIGDQTTTTVIGSGSPFKRRRIHTPKTPVQSKSLRGFAMAGSRMEMDEDDEAAGSEEEKRSEEEEEEGSEETGSGVDEEEEEEEEEEGEGQRHSERNSQAGPVVVSIRAASQDVMSEDESIQRDQLPDASPKPIPVQRREYAPINPFIEESLGDEEEDDEEEAVHEPLGNSKEHSPVNERDLAQDADSLSDDSYIDEQERQERDDKQIAQLIQEAEEAASHPSADSLKRANQALKGTAGSRYSVLNLASPLDVSMEDIKSQATAQSQWDKAVLSDRKALEDGDNARVTDNVNKADAEAQLSLTVSKPDFARMSIAGQFNLGFILAMRANEETGDDDLFIIDQHAADEKFNFERFTRSLNLDPQRLAQPKQLYLTAVEEEIILSHSEALSANGFVIETDTTGKTPVGERCKLLCLPMSKETTFDLSDLEELLHLLSDHPSGSSMHNIPRPSKVRKMLAMRACRSSIMVGKTLSLTQMQKVVRNLGEMDKPWNCPHGRPTMRHLAGLGSWKAWDGLAEYEKDDGGIGGGDTDWGGWVRKRKACLD